MVVAHPEDIDIGVQQIKSIHLLRVLHIGEGHVDFEPFFDRVRASGYSGYATVESTSVRPDGSIDFDRINRSLQRVREALKAK